MKAGCPSDISAPTETLPPYDGIMPNEVASLAHLIVDPTRSRLLLSLLDGRARTGTELARHVGVAPSTSANTSVACSTPAWVRVQAKGRHRYWRLRNADVASLLERLAVTASQLERAAPAAPEHHGR